MNRDRFLRIAKGIPQDLVAKHLGISQAWYSKIERGFHKPTAEQRKIIDKVLGVNFDEQEGGQHE